MCNPASFVLTKTRVFWSKYTNSHLEIILEFGLHVDGVRGPNTVSVEIVPPNGDYGADLDSWTFRVDQDVIPDWFDAAECETRVRQELPEWRQWHCCAQGDRRDNEALRFPADEIERFEREGGVAQPRQAAPPTPFKRYAINRRSR